MYLLPGSPTLLLLLSALRYISATPNVPGQHIIALPSTRTASPIQEALKRGFVIPDVLDDFEPPYLLSIAYPQSHKNVKYGNDIPVKSVSSRPSFEFHPFPPTGKQPNSHNKTFTLILTDPDAKSRKDPEWSEMCHWILTNLTAPGTFDSSASQEGELVEYLPPSPPPKTGKHRYVFVLLEGQEGRELNPPAARKHWGYGKVRHGVRDWAKENGLKVVGANFFQAQDKEQ